MILAREQLDWQTKMTNDLYSGLDEENDMNHPFSPKDHFEGFSGIGE